jgi:hypothetical protein
MHRTLTTLAAALAAAFLTPAQADVVTDWSRRTDQLITAARIGTPPAIRTMAIVQTAAWRALQAAPRVRDDGAAQHAAVAAAHRVVLGKLLPQQQGAVDAAYAAALAAIAEGPARQAGIAAGERAAAQVLAERADDGAAAPDTYRPHTQPGVYVPTAGAAVPHWGQRKPWLMTSPSQFRPAPPPSLASATWVRDYEEVRRLGGRASSERSAAQTDAARFWDYSLPAVYHGVVRSVADQPGRDVVANAQLLATVAQAMDDALISVFDAKYHYHFWRPATAIRNGDADGNDATTRDPSWAPLIDAPMHPEYPSGHSILASAVAAVLRAEVGAGALPELATTSPTAPGGPTAARRWTSLDAFEREVSDARVHAGIHFRSATDAGAAMGRRIGELAAARLLAAPH